MIRDLKYLTLSDIHLGHSKNKTEEIIANLNRFFGNFQETSQFTDLDIIFIAGDLFDTLLDFPSSTVYEITVWLSRLVLFCARYDIRLRILEGTPSHDWGQSKILNAILHVLDINVDARYVDTISVEYMEEFQLYVLYVPDEASPSADLTYHYVQDALKAHRIVEVDIAIMHGVFTYQMLNIPGHHQAHNESYYLGIVKYFITIGHFHVFSTYERIIAQGSFDRLTHGEEDPKGAVVCYIGSEPRWEFVENTTAKQFRTIVFKSMDLALSTRQLERLLESLPINSHVRIKAHRAHPFYAGIDKFRTLYPLYYFSRLDSAKEDDAHQLQNTAAIPEQYIPITITSENIVRLIMTSVEQQYQLLESEQSLLTTLLEDQCGALK